MSEDSDTGRSGKATPGSGPLNTVVTVDDVNDLEHVLNETLTQF